MLRSGPTIPHFCCPGEWEGLAAENDKLEIFRRIRLRNKIDWGLNNAMNIIYLRLTYN